MQSYPWALVLAGVQLIEPDSLGKVSCIHVNQQHPPQMPFLWDVHSVAFSTLSQAPPGLLVLSATLCTLWAAKQRPLSHLLCAMVECVLLNFQLPCSALSNPLSQVSMQTSSQKAKHKPASAFNIPFKFTVIWGVVSAFCIFLSSYLYFSKEWLLLPSC